jgi:hypothetical protein
MTASTIMTVRIEPALLDALRRRAKRAGRSLSAEVIDVLRRDLQPVVPGRPRKTMGMFSVFEAPELAVFGAHRRSLSARIAKRHRRAR